MFDLEKLKDNNATFWVFRLPELRKIAAECGWAIAIHGSLVHDLDLMAMPWIENHTTADELAQRFTDINEPRWRRPTMGTCPYWTSSRCVLLSQRACVHYRKKI